MVRVHSGRCLCGGVRFRITGALNAVQVCLCSQCRQAQGGPFATNIPVDRSAFSVIHSEPLLRRFESSPGKRRVFCSVCGSPVFSEKTDLPGTVRVRAGLLNEPVEVQPGRHQHLDSRCAWWPLEGDGAERESEPAAPGA